jgi:hypothetical protein
VTAAAILIPADVSGDPWRARALDYVQTWYARHFPSVPLHLGAPAAGDPWSKGAAVADALTRAPAGAQVLVLADADSFMLNPADLADAVELVIAGKPWCVPHRSVYRLRDKETARLEDAPELKPRLGWTCRPVYEGPPGGGITVLNREAFDLVGGVDPRFLGWGGEDVALGWALDTLIGPAVRLEGRLVHLWHPHPAPNLRGSADSEELVAAYRRARGVRRRMLAVVAGEQWEPAPELAEPVTFRMIANRTSLRLPCGDVVRFTRNTYTTTDPDTVEQLRSFNIIREDRRR